MVDEAVGEGWALAADDELDRLLDPARQFLVALRVVPERDLSRAVRS